jgi:cytochrome oxidase Cu insertion factor (SCO1/SenC/PrrC family)
MHWEHLELDISREVTQNPQAMLKKILLAIGVVIVAFAVLVAFALYHYPKAQVVSASSQAAPDFTLKDARGQDFTLSSLRGHKAVLYFYRGYW